MKKLLSSLRRVPVAVILCAAAAGSFAANVTPADAAAMVKKGIAYIKANGKEKGYAEISAPLSQFKDRELYLVVYGIDGTVRAHGANEKMIGKNLIDLKDTDGKPFVAERSELAKVKDSFWHEYKFTNPATGKIQHKRMYCERLDDSVVCGGIYR